MRPCRSRFYDGGEVLLQGVAPWLILVGCRVPGMGVWNAAGLAFLAVCMAFFAKLTGIMVVGAALLAGAMEALMRLRRITAGMVAGASGAFLALGMLYLVWFSRGATPASGSEWSFRLGNVFFAWATPWGAGISWLEMVGSVLFRRNPLLRDPAVTGEVSVSVACLLLPPVALFWGCDSEGLAAECRQSASEGTRHNHRLVLLRVRGSDERDLPPWRRCQPRRTARARRGHAGLLLRSCDC